MLKKTGLFIAFIIITALIASCASSKSSVIVSTEDQYTVIGTAKNEALALSYAMKKAQSVCDTQRKLTVSVLSQTVKDNSARRDLRKTNEDVAHVAAATNDLTDFPHLSKDQDYEATVVFKCLYPKNVRCTYCFRVSNKLG